METGSTYWLPFLANFQNGAMLIEAVKNQDQFIRYPKVVSPLVQDDLKTYEAFHLQEVLKTEDPLLNRISPLWDSVVIDETTRKIIFISSKSSPNDFRKESLMLGLPLKKEYDNHIQNIFNVKDVTPWHEEYGELGEKLLFITLFNLPKYGCLANGWRGELLFLNLAGDITSETTSKETWQCFHEGTKKTLLGSENPYILRNVLFSTIEIS